MRRDARAITAFGRWRALSTFAISSSCGARTAGNKKAHQPEVNRDRPTIRRTTSLVALAGSSERLNGDADHSANSGLLSSFSPFATMRNASSGNGRWSARASIVSASSHWSNSSGVVRMTGMAFG
jgi:hypothetical protein